jgi:hypothetical protein
MAKKGTKPWNTGKHWKQFCLRNHDTWICGRTEPNGTCKLCVLENGRKDPLVDSRKKQFCKNGHDTFVTGRTNSNCDICLVEYTKERYKNFKDIIDARNKAWRDEHKEEIAEANRIYRQNNREKLTKAKMIWQHKKEKTDIYYKLKRNLRSRIKEAVKRNAKAGSAVKDLGCSVEFFKEYIEKMFYTNTMEWPTWGKVWQLDHIIPLWKFDLTDPVQFKQAVHYTNMQPLTILDHRKKSSKEKTEFSRILWELKKKSLDK